MIPVAVNTQITIPPQVSLLATPLPESVALRPLPDAIAPSVPNYAILPEHKGKGFSRHNSRNENTPIVEFTEILSVPIPAKLSSSIASFSPEIIFAAHLLAQDEKYVEGEAEDFLASYEAFAKNSQEEKYKKENTALSALPLSGLFASLL